MRILHLTILSYLATGLFVPLLADNPKRSGKAIYQEWRKEYEDTYLRNKAVYPGIWIVQSLSSLKSFKEVEDCSDEPVLIDVGKAALEAEEAWNTFLLFAVARALKIDYEPIIENEYGGDLYQIREIVKLAIEKLEDSQKIRAKVRGGE